MKALMNEALMNTPVLKSNILTIYIGRFSPFHNGHAEVLKRAQTRSSNVLVLLGSINQAPDPKNPWSYEERAEIISSWVARPNASTKTPVAIRGIRDFLYLGDQMWIANVQDVVAEYIKTLEEAPTEIRITGADRDSSTFYLKYFPNWIADLVEEDQEVSKFLTATAVREIYFGRTFGGKEITAQHAELLLKSFLPTETINALRNFESTEMYDSLREEHLFNVGYRKPYAVRPAVKDLAGNVIDPGLPYEVIFQTVDACVIVAGHILLIRRKYRPGKGLWALPGGFVNPRERLFDACIRELREETKIKVPDPILRSSMIYKDDFDYPDRSMRGRIISKGYLFKLPDFVVDGKISLPQIKGTGADDTDRARWVPINEVMKNPKMFFEDHYNIIESLLGKL